ncbi:hypothetical protein JM93_01168 [Roseibium hamelinense]|uniref:Uncharacterized protein n=1 Tax=Roseibium hamelinense TaxID=150831 RepID=A0A562TBJ4_9HYPH|nr:hypothetical protein JM93_01168 [Roseibium hamelinense]
MGRQSPVLGYYGIAWDLMGGQWNLLVSDPHKRARCCLPQDKLIKINRVLTALQNQDPQLHQPENRQG